MRYSNLDESKIIKKSTSNSETIETKEPLSQGSFYQEEVVQQEINSPIVQEVIDEKPIFVFGKDQITKEIKISSQAKQTILNIDIPNDQLRLIQVNTIKYYNELILEIELLKSLLNNFNNDNYDFLKNKFDYYIKELEYIKYKQETLAKLLK